MGYLITFQRKSFRSRKQNESLKCVLEATPQSQCEHKLTESLVFSGRLLLTYGNYLAQIGINDGDKA